MASTQDDVVVRLRLKDVAKFIADVKSGKLAIDDLEKKIKQAGQTSAREVSSSGGLGKLASHFGMLAGFAKTGAMAVGAAAVGIAGYAVKSAASLEQVTIAFTTMLGSAKAARDMVGSLQTFAQKTPFNLTDVQDATQHLLAFKFSAQSIIPTLTSVGDAVSGLNLGPEGFQRVILALGQMKAVSTVQGGEVLQLEQAGINVRDYLEKALHLTPQQLAGAMRTNSISANTAIPIILRGMEAQFKGMMKAESTTLGGMWSNFHDAMQQGLIKLANPFMPAMKKWLGQVTNYLGGPDGKSGLFDRAAKFMKVLPGNVTAGRSGFAAYNVGAILGTHGFDPAIEKGVRVVHNLGVIVKDVLVPALKDLSVILAPVVFVLEHLDSITGFVADHSAAFRVVLDGLAGSVLAYKGAVLAMNIGIAAYNLVTGIAEIKTVMFTDATNAQRLAIIGLAVATKAWAAIQGAIAFIQLAAGVRSLSEAWWLLNIAMDANPVGVVILAVAGLAAGFYLAYTKIKPFRDFINGLWADMRGFWDWITKVWNPTEWSTHTGATGQTIAPGLVGGATDVAAQNGGTVAHPGPLISIGHASGGTVTRDHMAWVGERGPELLNLRRGTDVIPLPRVPEFTGSRGPVHVHVMLDKREIAQAVYDDMGDRVARR